MAKRSDYISWDEYFMGVAILAAQRSKDPNTQVGACIVSNDNKILSIGYNGMPLNCSDDDFTWERDTADDNKYFYTVHSELNAILNYRGGSLEGSKIYVTLFPCNECAKAIIQSGIKAVIYRDDLYKDTKEVKASKRMLKTAGVDIIEYQSTGRVLEITLYSIKEGWCILRKRLWPCGGRRPESDPAGGAYGGCTIPFICCVLYQ